MLRVVLIEERTLILIYLGNSNIMNLKSPASTDRVAKEDTLTILKLRAREHHNNQNWKMIQLKDTDQLSTEEKKNNLKKKRKKSFK